MGLVFDQRGMVRNQSTPDIGAIEFNNPACVGAPSANGVASPTYALCPGEITTLGLQTLSSTTGFGYQWQSSTISQVGPFTPIAGANGLFYTIPPAAVNTWYSVVMTCTNPGGGSISPVGAVLISGITSSVVPCEDGFEGIGANNRLPNCSWSSNNLGSTCLTYTASGSGNRVPNTGVSFASFANNTPGTNYFYTNAIAMTAGITYSADVAWATEYFGYNNWTSLSILVGPNQSPTGLVQVANINNPISGAYKVLGNTFTIPTTGTYYVAIKAISTTGQAQYLSIDDLHITIPCQAGSVNSPSMTLSASVLTVCANQPVSLTASGADTYTWSTGANGSGITDSPQNAGIVNYVVVGQNALTGCTATLAVPVLVNPSPNTLIYANPASVCSGQPTNLSGLGATSYVWSNGASSANITVSPTVTTTYNVSGTNSYGCSASASQVITVLPLPTINATSSNADACKDDQITLTGAGGISYSWLASNSGLVLSGSQVNVTLSASTVFTVTGTNANGCVGKTTLTQNINNCTGINKYAASNGVRVYPNPTSGELTIELNSGNVSSVEVVDLTGRVILSNTGDSKVNVNLSNVANGIYYVKIKSNDSMEVVKVVKQ